MATTTTKRNLPSVCEWTKPGRLVVFILAATSIWCLLAEMYGLCDMRTFVVLILLPATIALYGLAAINRVSGDRLLWRAVIIGTLAGLAGAIVYDIFRVPFVFSRAWGLETFVPPMPLFKVFPRFGALILGQPLDQPSYSLGAHLLGWTYHFSNGATFGVMFAAIIGEACRRYGGGLPWAVLMAVGIEACLLLSPYATFFDITLTKRTVRDGDARSTPDIRCGDGPVLCVACAGMGVHPREIICLAAEELTV